MSGPYRNGGDVWVTLPEPSLDGLAGTKPAFAATVGQLRVEVNLPGFGCPALSVPLAMPTALV